MRHCTGSSLLAHCLHRYNRCINKVIGDSGGGKRTSTAAHVLVGGKFLLTCGGGGDDAEVTRTGVVVPMPARIPKITEFQRSVSVFSGSSCTLISRRATSKVSLINVMIGVKDSHFSLLDTLSRSELANRSQAEPCVRSPRTQCVCVFRKV